MKSLFLGIAFVVLIGIGGFVYGNALERPFEPITCPLDAKLCPDGTSVGRAGTSCVFPACPPPNTSVAELGIAFAIPFGFSETEPRAGSVVAYASDATPEPEAEIIISTFAVASSSTALLTLFYANEARARRRSAISRFARFASDNETMHVVVLSALSQKHGAPGFVRHFMIPMLIAFFFFWMSYALYLIRPRWSLELNYLFEQHAFDQYSAFLTQNESLLRQRSIESEFLAWYGRHPRSEYEFLRSVRNDELVHRNRSIHEIALHESRGRE